MNISFSENGWEEYLYWQASDKAMLKRINALLKAVTRYPFEGIGSPQPLKNELAGSWSRRIDQAHRLVYKVMDNEIIIAQCRYHY